MEIFSSYISVDGRHRGRPVLMALASGVGSLQTVDRWRQQMSPQTEPNYRAPLRCQRTDGVNKRPQYQTWGPRVDECSKHPLLALASGIIRLIRHLVLSSGIRIIRLIRHLVSSSGIRIRHHQIDSASGVGIRDWHPVLESGFGIRCWHKSHRRQLRHWQGESGERNFAKSVPMKTTGPT